MEYKSWKPSLTSQFLICPIPFHLDTYRGCTYNCTYCFARDFVTFSRRNSEHKESTYLVGNDAQSFSRWMNKVDKSGYDYSKGGEVATKERIPLKIGATADPFPYVEAREKITYKVLKVLDYYNYPTEIQTKNPAVLLSYVDEFIDPNWTIAVTLISTDEEFIKVCEPNAPTAKDRLNAIKALSDSGKRCFAKIQPAIYPKILKDLPSLIKSIADSGCWAVNIEGLKVRVSMPQTEQLLFKKIGDSINLDLRDYYKKNGKHTGSDWELSHELKLEYIGLAKELCKEYHIKLLVADNNMGAIGDGCECCGTEVLKDYKIWGNNSRTRSFGSLGYESEELGKCLVNFTRHSYGKDSKTMNEVAKEFIVKKEVIKKDAEYTIIHNAFPDKNREYKDYCPTISTPSSGGHIPCVAIESKVDIPKVAQALQTDGQLRSGVSWHNDTSQSHRNIRRLTPKECERLQAFPDDWTKYGIDKEGKEIQISDSQRYKCCGNAVTTSVIEVVGKHLVDKLDV
jgi:DNA repair photolyase